MAPQHTEPDSYTGPLGRRRTSTGCSCAAPHDADPAGADRPARSARGRRPGGEPRPGSPASPRRGTRPAQPAPARAPGYTPATVLALHRLGRPRRGGARDCRGAGPRRRPPTTSRHSWRPASPCRPTTPWSACSRSGRGPRTCSRPDDRVGAARRIPAGAWVAERDGAVVGVCEMEPPESAAWVTGSVQPAAGRVGDGVPRDAARRPPTSAGDGVGARLVRAAHARAAEAGASQVVLHHAAANPLSVPFWGRAGYRPLLTGWVALPALTLISRIS